MLKLSHDFTSITLLIIGNVPTLTNWAFDNFWQKDYSLANCAMDLTVNLITSTNTIPYLCNISVVNMWISNLANDSPTHDLLPAENGKNPCCWKMYCPFSSNHLSGRKASGSFHVSASWWIVQVLFMIIVPLGMS